MLVSVHLCSSSSVTLYQLTIIRKSSVQLSQLLWFFCIRVCSNSKFRPNTEYIRFLKKHWIEQVYKTRQHFVQDLALFSFYASPPLCYCIIFNQLTTPSEFSHYNKLNKIIIMIYNILSDINLQDWLLQAAHHWLQNSCGHWFEQLQVNLGWCWVRLRPLWGGFRLW